MKDHGKGSGLRLFLSRRRVLAAVYHAVPLLLLAGGGGVSQVLALPRELPLHQADLYKPHDLAG